MKSIQSTWFECTCQYGKTEADGLIKRVKETNVVEAVSFGEAEARIIEEMTPFAKDGLKVTAIKIARYAEIFFSDDTKDDRWYKAKVCFIILDEKSGTEKRQSVIYLVQANTINKAIKNIDEAMKGTLSDYISVQVSETSIFDVFRYNN